MSTTDPKKIAKNHFESFKKLYNKICERSDLTNWEETTKVLNDYWRDSFLPVHIKKEIAKLFENESLEMKIVLNFMHSFAVPIPQKKWFLGNAHSTALLHRPPCDAAIMFFDRFENGCLIAKHQFHLDLTPEFADAKMKTAIDNESFSAWLINDEMKEGRLNYNYRTGLSYEIADASDPDENAARAPYSFAKTKVWNGKSFILEIDGKIYQDKTEVVVFLDGDKITDTNHKIVQWAVRNTVDEQNVILLFESDFLAAGIIRDGNSGLLIECHEVPGSYMTACFAISPDWKHIVRRSARTHKLVGDIYKHMNFPADIDDIRWKKAREDLDNFAKENTDFFSHKRVDSIAEEYGEEFETKRIENLKIFCHDIRRLAAAIDEKPRVSFLGVVENVINYTQLRPENTLYNNQLTCECTGKVCRFMWDISPEMKTAPMQFKWSFVSNAYFSLLFSTLTNMVEMFLRLFRDREDCPLWEREKEYRKAAENKTPDYYSSVSYYPLDIYQRCNEPEFLGLTEDSASRATLDRYFRGEEHISSVTELLLKRPDIMLFDPRPLLPPISLIKKFCELFPDLGTRNVKNIAPEKLLIEEFDKWSLEKKPMKKSKSKPKSKSKASKKK